MSRRFSPTSLYNTYVRHVVSTIFTGSSPDTYPTSSFHPACVFLTATLTETRPSFPWYLWFAGGFVSALTAIIIPAVTHKVVTRTVPPSGLIPDFPAVDVIFEPHPEFSNLTDPVSTRLWHDMLHHGHIFVDDATRYSMKPGIPVSENGERLIVSGLHGLHCLRTLRNEMTMLILGHALETGTKHRAHNHPGRPDHCFDYLRQLIMCNLDLTYESARVDLDGVRRVADGWGTVHQCKDWSAINSWMLENLQWELSMEDWHEPDRNKPEGQDELYGDVYPLYSPLYNRTCS
ncbi:hypothetical protein BDV30DRAFT_235189 [Aspergillus minisclerotigenes]|uniref:Oxidase ustYa n=1 Tax=Aspergillus minisclerotigenes TaxID=656917 RepID=A0A5N6JDJ6_9EURO|nr:hypothetical protein BDV30DRAFT_235189 [Aspergillus minisclerotigenes]